MSEHHLWAGSVPTGGRHDLVVVDGRSFAISAEAGDMVAATHGLVYDDIRHLSRLRMTLDVGRVELWSATTPTPLSAVTVSRALVTVEGKREGLVFEASVVAGEPAVLFSSGSDACYEIGGDRAKDYNVDQDPITLD